MRTLWAKRTPVGPGVGSHPGEVSGVLGELLAIAGVEIAFERAGRAIQALLMLEVSDNTIRKQTQQMGEKQAQVETEWIEESQDEAWLQEREEGSGQCRSDYMVRWMVPRCRRARNGES